MSFQIGDLVCVVRSVITPICDLKGKAGRVKQVKSADGQIGVEFSENIGGNDLGGRCLPTCGFYFNPKHIQKMEPFAALFQKQWIKEWKPKLARKEEIDLTVLLED